MANSKYFPNTFIEMPVGLRKWRAKFKTIGRNVFVPHQPTLSQLMDKFGPDVKVTAKQLESFSWRRATPEEQAEYESGKKTYQSALIAGQAKEANDQLRWRTKQLKKAETAFVRQKMLWSKSEKRVVETTSALKALQATNQSLT